jgi:PAS domain S-box-containing protein
VKRLVVCFDLPLCSPGRLVKTVKALAGLSEKFIRMTHSGSSTSFPSQLAAYRDLFERLPDCVFLLDESTHVVLEANSACERILNIPREKMIGRPLEHWVEGSVRTDCSRALRVSMRRYQPRQFDTFWKTSDGRVLTLELSVCPLPLANQRQVVQVIAKDVTYRRESELRIQALERQIREIAPDAPPVQPCHQIVSFDECESSALIDIQAILAAGRLRVGRNRR